MMVESTKKRDRERKGTEKSKTRVLISIEVEKLGKKKKKIYKKKSNTKKNAPTQVSLYSDEWLLINELVNQLKLLKFIYGHNNNEQNEEI